MDIEAIRKILNADDVDDDVNSVENSVTPPHLQNLESIRLLGLFEYRFSTDAETQSFYRGVNARGHFAYFFVIDGVRFGISKEHIDYYWCEV